jgi:hypothetical protein
METRSVTVEAPSIKLEAKDTAEPTIGTLVVTALAAQQAWDAVRKQRTAAMAEVARLNTEQAKVEVELREATRTLLTEHNKTNPTGTPVVVVGPDNRVWYAGPAEVGQIMTGIPFMYLRELSPLCVHGSLKTNLVSVLAQVYAYGMQHQVTGSVSVAEICNKELDPSKKLMMEVYDEVVTIMNKKTAPKDNEQ